MMTVWSPGVIRGCGGPEVEGLQVRAGSVGVGCSFTALLVDIYLAVLGCYYNWKCHSIDLLPRVRLIFCKFK